MPEAYFETIQTFIIGHYKTLVLVTHLQLVRGFSPASAIKISHSFHQKWIELTASTPTIPHHKNNFLHGFYLLKGITLDCDDTRESTVARDPTTKKNFFPNPSLPGVSTFISNHIDDLWESIKGKAGKGESDARVNREWWRCAIFSILELLTQYENGSFRRILNSVAQYQWSHHSAWWLHWAFQPAEYQKSQIPNCLLSSSTLDRLKN